MDQQGKDLLDMDTRMFSAKGSIDSLHQEIADYFFPERANFTQTISLSEEFASHLSDFTPVLVRRSLADQIQSMVRPQDRQWFEKSVDNLDVERDLASQQFLQFMTQTTRSVIYDRASGFRRMAKEHEGDFSGFGNAASLVAYNADRSGFVMRNHHLKNMAWSEDQNGNVDHAHRKADMKARSMAAQFGEEKLPTRVKTALQNKDEKSEFKVRHIFVPLSKYDPYRKFPKWAKWADIYVTEDGKILQENPSETFDYVISRWQTISDHAYAFSPATIVALPQARMLQRMMWTLIEAGEKQVDPPLIATEDAINSAIDLQSGGITYIDAEYDERLGNALRPIDLGKNVGLGNALVSDTRAMLEEAFYLNKLNPLSMRDKEMTAFEAGQLVSEYIRTALPLFDPIESEWTDNLLEVCTAKIMRAGGYGPTDRNGVPEQLPDGLLGKSIKNQFNTTLKEARDRQTLDAYVESSNLLAAAAQVDQSAIAEVDTRTMFRDAFGVVPGAKADWLVSAGEAQRGREQMQQQAAEKAELAQVSEVAGVATDVGNAADALQAVA